MKTFIKIISTAIILAGLVQCTRNSSDTEDLQDSTRYAVLPAITNAETSNLAFMFEEEKLARDTYIYLYQKWNIQQFNNIKNSEQSHMNAVENLLIRYKIAYPKLAEGKFQNQDLQALYNQLIAQGSTSNIEALKVGATIEDVDIKDLRNLSAETTNSLILNVYSNLMCGSRNHMRAFSGSLKNLGVTYVPQFITQAEYDAIINSSNEQCGN